MLFLLELPLLWQSSKPANGDWPYTSGERRGSHYSPLDQIRASNVKQLGLAWSYDTATTCGLEAPLLPTPSKSVPAPRRTTGIAPPDMGSTRSPAVDRRSPLLFPAVFESYRQILRDDVLAKVGMPSFKDAFTPQEVDAKRSYLLFERAKLKAK